MTGLTWTRLASGNYGAIAGGGWFYLAGQVDRSWFLEAWRDGAAAAATASYGYPRLAGAQAEAAERHDMVALLTGKYGLDPATAHDILATARRNGSEEATITHRPAPGAQPAETWRIRIATDPAGYTLEQLPHHAAAASQGGRP